VRSDVKHIMALTRLNGIGPILSRQLISHCGSAEEVFKSSMSALSKIPQIGNQKARLIKYDDVAEDVDKELEFAEKKGVSVLTYLDEAYPRRLNNYEDAPIILYYKGTVDLNALRTVAIVGTRKPTDYGILSCEKIVEDLGKYDPIIVSGMAYGVDSTAHRSSVRNNIPTIGVLGHGLDRLYPPTNRDLAAKMIENGGLLTEFPSGTNPDRENFPMRNRIIAALSDVVIVIESKRKGGSMITADLANGYFKDVFALPGRINDDHSSGCNLLIKSLKASLLESAKDIAYIMRWEERTDTKKQQELFIELNEIETKIIDHFRSSKEKEITIDKLHYQLQLPVSQLSGLLLELEFKGMIKSLPGKKYVLT